MFPEDLIPDAKTGANGEIRTHDLLFTKWLAGFPDCPSSSPLALICI
jgi:hypothetical protein